MFLAKAKQRAFITAHTVPQNGERDHVLAEIPVRHPYRRRLQYRRMPFQNFVNLLGGDVHSAFDNQFLRAANDEEVTVLIPIGEVASEEPAASVECRSRSCRVLVIALHHPIPAK